MATPQELENLKTWLDQHSSGYLLVTRCGEFVGTETIQRLAESCNEIEIEGHRVYLNWENRSASPVQSSYESIVAILNEPNPRIQLQSTPLTFDEFMERSPGKLELSGGFLGGSIEDAFNLLDISLETFGLLKVVRRAPKELWEAALNQAYEQASEVDSSAGRDK